MYKRQVLDDVPVVAHKSNFGNLGPGTSVVELVGSLLAMKNGTVPPTLNYDNADPACPVNINSSPTPFDGSALLKTGHSATGQTVSVVFEKL